MTTREDLINLRREIDEYKDISLSDQDILKLVGGKANVITYPKLSSFKSIDEVLGHHGAAFILYQTHPNYGHWCCLTLRPMYESPHKDKMLIEFFDPYGNEVDSQLDHISEPYRTESGQNVPYLTHLLLDCDYKLSYNEFPFQELSPNIKDCGRWTSLRIMLKDLPLKDFKDLFLNIYSDDIATFLTMEEGQGV